MMSVVITGLTFNRRKGEIGERESLVLAYFDCETRGLRMNACALVRSTKGGFTVWPPKLEGREALRRSLVIIDDSLRHEMTEAARAAYRALGGTDAEWTPRPLD